MVFSKPIFLFGFLPIVLLLYYIVPRKLKNFVLLFMSLIFYAWGEPKLLLLMVFTIFTDYTAGVLINKYSNKPVVAKIVFVATLVINLALLGVFKYANFVIESVNTIVAGEFDLLEISLPIGISFYTFQALSYVIDVYKKVVPVEKNLLNFTTYVVLFPQLIAGPIVQYKTVAKELSKRQESVELFSEGIWRFSVGLAKKVIIANQIGAIWTEFHGTPEFLTVGKAWIGAIAFTFQIYFDFSGYSDMAIGLGKMFGFNFLENFNYPYISKSITEFWRRWHISLGTWFKEYVYIPLGGNRKGLIRQIFNILIVWMLTGLWHGASWNFVIWGLYFGLILVLEKAFLLKILKKIPAFFAHLYSLLLIVFGWVIFECGTTNEIISFFKGMFGIGVSLWNKETTYILCNSSLIFVLAAICSTQIGKNIKEKLSRKFKNDYWKCVAVTILLLLSVMFLAGDSYNPFLYFRF